MEEEINRVLDESDGDAFWDSLKVPIFWVDQIATNSRPKRQKKVDRSNLFSDSRKPVKVESGLSSQSPLLNPRREKETESFINYEHQFSPDAYQYLPVKRVFEKRSRDREIGVCFLNRAIGRMPSRPTLDMLDRRGVFKRYDYRWALTMYFPYER